MSNEIQPVNPFGFRPKDAKLRVALIGSDATINRLPNVVAFVPRESNIGDPTPRESPDKSKILPFTPENWIDETYFERNLRLNITNTIFIAIRSDELTKLERHSGKFVREIINSIDKPDPQDKPARIGSNKISIIRCVERTIAELEDIEQKDFGKLPPNKKQMLITWADILRIRIDDARFMGREIGRKEVKIKLMKQIEAHFSPKDKKPFSTD